MHVHIKLSLRINDHFIDLRISSKQQVTILSADRQRMFIIVAHKYLQIFPQCSVVSL